MARGRELRLGGEEGKKRGRMAGRLAWLAPQPPRDHAPGAPLGQVEEGSWIWLDIGCLSGTRGNRADRALSNQIQATAKPSAGVPRRSSLTLWSLEGEQEFRRSRHRALQHRDGYPSKGVEVRHKAVARLPMTRQGTCYLNIQRQRPVRPDHRGRAVVFGAPCACGRRSRHLTGEQQARCGEVSCP